MPKDAASARLKTHVRAAEIGAIGDTRASSVMFSPAGNLLAVTGAGGVRAWNLDEKLPSAKTVGIDAPAAAGEDPVFATDGRSLILKPEPSGFALHATAPLGTRVAVVESGEITVLDGDGKPLSKLDGAGRSR